LEIHKSRFISKESTVCKTRLLFWEDTLKNLLNGKMPKEPIGFVLKEAFDRSKIRVETLFRMVDFQVKIL